MDRFDREVEFDGAIDLARYAIGHIGPDGLGLSEAIEPVNALRVEPRNKNTANDRYSFRASVSIWRSLMSLQRSDSQASFRSCCKVNTASTPMA